MNNKEKLQTLIQDVFLFDSAEFRFDLKRDEVETWDSFGVVSMAVGVQEVFGYHFTPEEATSITGVEDIIKLLSSKGILFD
jgi:acyl carrier protein